MAPLSLVRKYEPVLLFSKDDKGRDENFFPMAVEHYVAHCRLYRKEVGPVEVPDGLSLETLGQISPPESREHYLAYAADSVLSQSPSLWERLRKGGLALYGIEGQVEPHLLVKETDAVSFALQDPALRRVDEGPGTGPGAAGPGGMTFAPPGGGPPSVEAPAEADFLITDLQHLPPELHAEALKRYQPYRDFSNYPPVYYYRVMYSRGYRVIQYWFFYAYNDWGTGHGGINDHEGDWETVFVFLRGDRPAYVAYSAHIGPPGRAAWDDPALEKRFRNHPVVYVGSGSHANYLQPGPHPIPILSVKDHAYGNSAVAVGPGTGVPWGRPVNLEQQPWALNYAGAWGALVKKWGASWLVPGAQAPVGPAWHFEPWETPVAWAEIPY